MYKRILVPTDGSDITGHAVQTAIDLARLTGATLYTLSVHEPYPYAASVTDMQPVQPAIYDDIQERTVRAHVDAVVQACAAAGIACQAQTVLALHPWEAIIDHAKESGCDLIVMASHGRRGMSALLLGSETQKVLTHTTVPVLVVR